MAGEMVVCSKVLQTREDATAQVDPMGMSQELSLEAQLAAQKAEAERLEEEKRVLQEGINNQTLETEKIKEDLARQQELAGQLAKSLSTTKEEKDKVSTEAKAKQEELEKELGARQKTEEEKSGERQKRISDRMKLAFKMAAKLWGHKIDGWKIPSTDETDKHRKINLFVGSVQKSDFVTIGEDPRDPRWSLPQSDSDLASCRSLAFKICDELKAAEEAEREKPKLTGKDLADAIKRAEEIARTGCGSTTTGEMAPHILHELLK